MNVPVAVPPPDDGIARIGPHSVLQLTFLIDDVLGEEERKRLMLISGMAELPQFQGMIPETPAAALHQALRAHHPDLAPALTRRAGERTAQHIIEKRFPVAALKVISSLPPWLAGPLLASVVKTHAWTFAGSGKFTVRSKHPLVLVLHDNPVVRGEYSTKPICHWHSAAFQWLFRSIVDPRLCCVETHCCANGSPSCVFEIR